jgi:hypothetical protein
MIMINEIPEGPIVGKPTCNTAEAIIPPTAPSNPTGLENGTVSIKLDTPCLVPKEKPDNNGNDVFSDLEINSTLPDKVDGAVNNDDGPSSDKGEVPSSDDGDSLPEFDDTAFVQGSVPSNINNLSSLVGDDEILNSSAEVDVLSTESSYQDLSTPTSEAISGKTYQQALAGNSLSQPRNGRRQDKLGVPSTIQLLHENSPHIDPNTHRLSPSPSKRRKSIPVSDRKLKKNGSPSDGTFAPANEAFLKNMSEKKKKKKKVSTPVATPAKGKKKKT